MTFTPTREEYFSTFQLLDQDYFSELDLDFLQEIVEIQRDIQNEEDKDKRSYMKDFDFPEIEYSDFGSDITGARY